MTTDRRVNRTSDKWLALRYLCEALRAKSDASAVALVDASGSVVSGVGSSRDLAVLEQTAGPAADGHWDEGLLDRTEGVDVLARPVSASGITFYLAALGTRAPGLPEAARAVSRILAAA